MLILNLLISFAGVGAVEVTDAEHGSCEVGEESGRKEGERLNDAEVL